MNTREEKMTTKGICLIVIMLLSFTGVMAVAPSDTAYTIKRGDVLDISVMEHPEFSMEGLIVLPDGNIQFPGIGSIPTAGKRIKEFSTIMTGYAGKYVVNPVVTVFIRSMPNQVVNVVGYVSKPGQVTIFESTDLVTVLSKAGGIKDIRACKWVTIIRSNQHFEKYRVSDLFNNDSEKSKIPKLEIGDTVYVIEPREVNWSKLSFFSTLGYIVLMILYYTK